jgi:hypothetical protein
MESTTGDFIPDDAPQSFAYNGDDTLNYIEVTHDGNTWRQTYGYTDGKVTSISGWELQS